MRQAVHRQLQPRVPAGRCSRSKIHVTVSNKYYGSDLHVAKICVHSTRAAALAAEQPSVGDTPQSTPARGDDSSTFWQIVIPTALVLLVCNVDRICMSVAVIPMSNSFGWSPAVQGFIGAAFLWGYMATQLIGGQAADKYGGKLVISCAIVFFSLASLLPLAAPFVPAANMLALIAVSRFLGEISYLAAGPPPVSPTHIYVTDCALRCVQWVWGRELCCPP